MKKKHLKSLNTIEKWLSKESGDVKSVKEAFQTIRSTLETLPDLEVSDANGALPAPHEISNEPDTIAVYSDGGCRGNPGPGAYAFVIQEHNGEVLAEGVEYEAHTTNNKMELSGPLKGLHELLEVLPAKGKDPLRTKIKIITDSKYVVDGMKSWVQSWKARGWKKADNKAPENMDLWQALDSVREKFMQVEWMWVKGHAGHPQNEYCDRKANEVMDVHSSL
ncbi:MAG: ribonuclease HI [Bdellovibrionales bacterium]|nr:ribonuclease HI [Bdellovibrionales bacterium]